ncbi:hypothetical protein [Archangium lansingense]|uniref:Uncharacterized protein n=1 Tax=Archangium lansingense TaxID=2995310 RepID=A0ABT3ZU42_9BACT|nr:hypothetical protein [Archangium lansinium]MCY1072910.1 hypothetical protein [Archangium lansinium]
MPRERDDVERVRERDELALRRVLPLAVVLLRDLPPTLRVLRTGFARRVELFAEVLVELFFDEPFASPALLRCLFTTRAASCLARPVLAPRLRADCLIFEYCR